MDCLLRATATSRANALDESIISQYTVGPFVLPYRFVRSNSKAKIVATPARHQSALRTAAPTEVNRTTCDRGMLRTRDLYNATALRDRHRDWSVEERGEDMRQGSELSPAKASLDNDAVNIHLRCTDISRMAGKSSRMASFVVIVITRESARSDRHSSTRGLDDLFAFPGNQVSSTLISEAFLV